MASCKKNKNHEHQFKHIDKVDATCTIEGVLEHYECTSCGKKYLDKDGNNEITNTSIPRIEHIWKNADCTTPKTCAICNTTDGSPLGHHIVHQDAKDATCTEEGHNAYDMCTRCDYTTNQTIPALGHNLGEWVVDVEATCTTEGTKHQACTRCDYIANEKIDALGHNLGEWVVDVEATCTTEGAKHQACTRCDYVTNEKIEIVGHTWTDTTVETEKICTLCGIINIPTEISASIQLPTSYNEQPITWLSSDHEALLDDGTIVASNVKRVVTLTATFTFNGQEKISEYSITIQPVSANVDAYQYAYAYFSGRLSGKINKNVNLITKPYSGYSVKYESLDENVITSKGVIHQTIFDQTAIMNIYIIKDNIAVLYPHIVNVIAYTSVQRVNLSKPVVEKLMEDFQNGTIDTLPVRIDEYETELKWSADIPEMIVLGNMVLTPMEKTDVKLSCTIVYEKSTFIKKYELKNVGGTISKELYIQKLIEALSRVELKGSINHLYDQYNTGELYLEYQERINSGGVLNLFTPNTLDVNREKLIDVNLANDAYANKFFGSNSLGTKTKPVLPQSVLDAKMYEGYQMPNKDNVLWVVVHESAMTIAGQNALLLANLQYNSAFNNPDAREASWNYQVDAYSIYQSFEDNVICWHAGDGTGYGTGNTNGIGIEMCVNRDGNYEGTLHNNAKLVASFMLKYNLNISNVKRHFDMSGKECPSYLIRTSRWEEFVEMVRMEYLLQKYLGTATIKYDLSTADCTTTDSVLAKYFDKGANGLWYNKVVQEEVFVNYHITVTLDGKTYEASSIFSLLPNEVKNEQ